MYNFKEVQNLGSLSYEQTPKITDEFQIVSYYIITIKKRKWKSVMKHALLLRKASYRNLKNLTCLLSMINSWILARK